MNSGGGRKQAQDGEEQARVGFKSPMHESGPLFPGNFTQRQLLRCTAFPPRHLQTTLKQRSTILNREKFKRHNPILHSLDAIRYKKGLTLS